MAKIVECIPNFSEGIRREILDELIQAASSVAGVTLLDHAPDTSHNRTVFTLVGSPEGIQEGAFQMAKIAVEKIDLTKHKGEHPRMGAVDVIPFVPIKEVTMEECIAISKAVAERVHKELGMAVFLYEESATAPHRKNLAAIRKGQFEGMAEKVHEEKWIPDFGTDIHPTAGAVAIGARMPLVAFNINLSTSDIQIANHIAKIIRESTGGIKHVKAIGVMLEDRNIAQVSINMVNYEKTPLYRAFEMVRFEAERYGVQIIGSEIIGLTPKNALIDAAEYYLKIENFDSQKQVLENYLL